MRLILLKYLTPKRQHIYIVICINLSFWATLLVIALTVKKSTSIA
jgi:hypothetical protein